MYLVEVGWGDVDWIGLAQDRNRWRVLWIGVMWTLQLVSRSRKLGSVRPLPHSFMASA
jgi:hypothetical protein